ncbi:hypothetical protein FRACYDRAFT_233039 [Fragilariopsis cylindrus CCMP1102]|uniref:Uncharacterized protein n=1 Tax=Fragilariopsis cylindrus CCMP1102 TaxID=635003 RepID=A0A1E7FXL1_9STRA|nr:hypothetical protein FRACYDRAFT_233039 [Fragilariopsis cylindrus CCMP1102]|eukprot:OEU22874.1 hypothetical protein FRACYDRAFT_233039 [Fragilariopsis cylindrus CCMP1102]
MPRHQKYPNGTKVSKYFTDNLVRDDQATPSARLHYGDRREGVVVSYEPTITSGFGVYEVLDWTYRVCFELDEHLHIEIFHDMSEKELESCLHKNCPYHLSFSKDLDRVPNMAEVLFYLDNYDIAISIFFLALIMPNRPVSIIKKLMEKRSWPYECEHFRNWLAIALTVAAKPGKNGTRNLVGIDEEIIRLILKKTNDFSTTRQIVSSVLEPIYNFIICGSEEYRGSDRYPSLAYVVLEESDDAVALVLADHYQGLRDIPQEILKYALSCTKKRNSKGVPVRISDCFYNNRFRGMRNTIRLSLMEELFLFIDSKKLPLFVRFLKTFVNTKSNNRNLVANASLTNMVLYTLDNMSSTWRVSNRGAHLSSWTKFVAAHQEIKTLNNHRQTVLVMSPLLYAISLGFPWNSVLRDLVAADPSALESVDFVELLPPFLMAATVGCTPRMCPARVAGTNYSEDLIFADRTTVENIFELLRANPAMLAKASEKGNVEAARKSLRTRKKETKAINGKRKFVQSALSFQPITSHVK